jgi:hypothetical protein
VTKPIVWNYGGGKQSVAVGVLIAQGRLPVPERALIVNTGRESSSTWRYLTEHMQPLLDTVGLTVEVVPHSYSLVDLYNTKGRVLIPGWTKGGTGQLRTFCSGEWKRDAAYRWLREPERGYGPKNPIIQWLGYSLDEIGRCAPSRRKWAEVQWPLLMGYGITMTRQQCVELILSHGLPEPKKSRCWMCPFMTNAEWADQKEHEPADHQKAIALDLEIAERDQRGGIYIHHSGVPLSEADLSIPDPPEHPLFGRADSSCNAAGCWT